MGAKLSSGRARSKGKVEQDAKATATEVKSVKDPDEILPGESTPLRKSSTWRLSRRRFGLPNIFRQLKNGYLELVNAVIRPPRAVYGLRDLGPRRFTMSGRSYERKDLRVNGGRGLELACSWWQPVSDERLAEQLPCVVYMHGNASCRLEALDCLQPVLQMGLTLFAFDFAGCGQSEGETITLGYREKDDAQAIVEYLRKSGSVSTIAFWGRSMGAATALLHGHRDPSIAALVLDSPFSSLEQLAREVIDRAQLRYKPKMLVNAGLRILRSAIMKRTGLDILKLRPIENVSKCFIPAIFVAGQEDQFIPPHHTGDIFRQYAGDKDLIMVRGGHNSQRPQSFMYNVSLFLYYTLCVPAGLVDARPGLEPPALPRPPRSEVAAPEQRHEQPETAREYIRSQLRRVTGGSQAQAEPPLAAAGVVDSMSRLVGSATSRTQSTLPDRRTAADQLRHSEVEVHLVDQ